MIYFKAPITPIMKMDKKEQIIKNCFIESIGKSMTLYTDIMTYRSACVTLESYKSAFPMYDHKIRSLEIVEI